MDIPSSPFLTSTPYPDHTDELPDNSYAHSTASDDYEALICMQEETKVRKNKAGVVIQHRAWKLEEAFRGHSDYVMETPLQPKKPIRKSLTPRPESPSFHVNSKSTPLKHPINSSPPIRKRPRSPCSKFSAKLNAVGGFLIGEESDESDTTNDEPPHKRRMPYIEDNLDAHRSPKYSQANPATDLLDQISIEREKIVLGVEESTDIDLTRCYQQCFTSNLLPPAIIQTPDIITATTCSGKLVPVNLRKEPVSISFEQAIAARSTTATGRAKKSYYGIQLHELVKQAELMTEESDKNMAEEVLPTIEETTTHLGPQKSLMWTEKYRARNFMELVGDDRTHRQVLRWLKSWDPIVFPKSKRAKHMATKQSDLESENEHRKIMLLSGPPGLGKTTLAHVCAVQAGYEVMEINASDDRSRDVVNGRIKTSIGTESVKTGSRVQSKTGHVQRTVQPLCIIVDEVDGVISGSGDSGEGGFIKALIDLILLDRKNAVAHDTNLSNTHRRKKKNDSFRFRRPLILICNDIYHPSLRQLRQSNYVEIIRVRKPPLETIVTRMKSIFGKEGVICDEDAVRRLCEATWGMNAGDTRRSISTGDGDIRSILVVGEWVASKLKASSMERRNIKLTKKWVEQNILNNLSHEGNGARGNGHGGTRDIVTRVFTEGAGFSKPAFVNPLKMSEEQPKGHLGVAELTKKAGMERLREAVEANGETTRIMTDIFSQYPDQPFNDDSMLSKPNAAYEWLHFHDLCSSRVFSDQAFELLPYLCQPILACHHLFASPVRYRLGNTDPKNWREEEIANPTPYSGPRADFDAHEAEKSNRAIISALQTGLQAAQVRNFKNPEKIAVEILPYLVKLLIPGVKPVIIGGSGDRKSTASVRKETEKAMIQRSVGIMEDLGITFQHEKLDDISGIGRNWVYRMEPPLDTLTTFETSSSFSTSALLPPLCYAIRQLLGQGYEKNKIERESITRQVRYQALNSVDASKKSTLIQESPAPILQRNIKKNFFGVLINDPNPLQEYDRPEDKDKIRDQRIWVTFHEGFSNAVRKTLTIEDLMRGL
ncbi:unnamed protein product [Blumeria hordei]|uniref:AAA+ ATPase domain-containing protein n=1 Tax=Blumeria hordei TaxID=2867405 RepID=A0A383US18_BLUHO|nr:unnamed protein product [Blumeria hordei]